MSPLGSGAGRVYGFFEYRGHLMEASTQDLVPKEKQINELSFSFQRGGQGGKVVLDGMSGLVGPRGGRGCPKTGKGQRFLLLLIFVVKKNTMKNALA